VRDQVSHPYKTTGKIVVLFILFYEFLERRHTSDLLVLYTTSCQNQVIPF